MVQTLDAQTFAITVQGTINNTLTFPNQSVSAPLSQAFSFNLTSGTGANQADRIWAAETTLAASGSTSIDLAGVLVDAIGTSLTFVRIKGLYVRALSTNTNNVLVGGAGSNQWATWLSAATTNIIVRPGGIFALFAPDATAYTVTAGTGDILQIANSGAGTSVTYDIAIIGASA